MFSGGRIDWLGLLAYLVVMFVGLPADVSIVIGIISLVLAYICYKKSEI